jgi:predicted HTH transcriptional regulator
MNFRVLKTEFFSLIDSISTFNSEQNNAKNVDLNDHFFDIKKESILNEKYSISNNQYVGSNSDKNQTSTDSRDTNDSPLLYKKTNRQNIIIGLLRKKNNLNIKDIASVIKDCSEKTIQRELVALVSLGILKKEGERRWSRYSLINGF